MIRKPTWTSCAALLLLAGCGSNGSQASTSDSGAADATTSGDGGSPADSGGTLIGDGASDSASGFGCSADLRSVVDQNGTVVMTIPS